MFMEILGASNVSLFEGSCQDTVYIARSKEINWELCQEMADRLGGGNCALGSQLSLLFQSEDTGMHHELMVAMVCPTKKDSRLYHNQYVGRDGKWVTDFDNKATCRQDKVEIFEYCKKVYPDKGITNIVELNKLVKVPNWCKLGHKKCVGNSKLVKPYRCLGKFFVKVTQLVTLVIGWKY